jgi:hypothetical protein
LTLHGAPGEDGESAFNPPLPDGDIGGRCAIDADLVNTAVQTDSWGHIKKHGRTDRPGSGR